MCIRDRNKIENAKIQISRLSSYSKDDPKYSKLTKKDELERKERKAREKAAQAQRHASYTCLLYTSLDQMLK